MHWIGNDPFRDCCVHGGVYFRIGNTILVDGKDSEWSISTAAFNFLRSLFRDHYILREEPLIPHCGFTMWPVASEPDGLLIPNCSSSVDWSIYRTGDKVVHEFTDGTTFDMNLSAWTEAVCSFADEIHEHFQTAWPKVIDDDQDKRGFELFMRLWQERRAAASSQNAESTNR